MKRIALSIILLAISLCLTSAEGGERPITELVPADSLVVYTAKHYGWLQATSQPAGPGGQPGISGSPITTIIDALNASGLIPDEGQVYADIVAALPLLGRFDHAIVLLDVSARVVPRDDPTSRPAEEESSLRLNSLQTAIIFRTDGRQDAVLDQLNRVIGRYTNQDVARLAQQSTAGFPYQHLSDARLPGWAVWEWGRLGDFFVLSFGAGAFQKIATTYSGRIPNLSADAWYSAAAKRTRVDRSMASWFIAFARLEERLGPIAEGRVARVTAALKADDMTHDLWTVGEEGRALTWYRCYRRAGQEVFRRYSDPHDYPADHRKIIPDAATQLAIIHVPTKWLIDNLPRAWVAAQSENNLQKWNRIWARLEEETGLDINGSLIDHLGENVVIFNYPPHPLRIPVALTVAIEIDNRRAVQMAIDALLTAWSQYLDDRAERNRTILVRVKVRRDDDGVWYLQAGILGPALKVTDRYVVISWSPQALRDALKYIEPTHRGAGSP